MLSHRWRDSDKNSLALAYRYPDASAVCGERQYENIRGIDALLNPVLIIEVLSTATERLDRRERFKAYKVIPGFREYLLVSQEDPRIDRHIRMLDGSWRIGCVEGIDSVLTLESIECSLELRDIYEGLAFKQPC